MTSLVGRLAFSVLFAAGLWAAPSEDASKSLLAQKDRAGVILERGCQPHYPPQFDLSGLPHYRPGPALNGWVRLHGNNYLVDGAPGEYRQSAIAREQLRKLE